MADLIGRLRAFEGSDELGNGDFSLLTEAATEIEALRAEVERLRADRGSQEQQTAHPAITHCENCGCDWLDNGLNPIGCPYCKQSTEIERLRKMHQDAYQRGLQAGSKGLREMYDAVQTVKRQDAWGNAQLTEALMEAEERAERAEAENKQLRAEMERVTCELMDAITRADKLEEALRELVGVFSESGMYDDEVFDKARAALAGENNSRGTSP